MTQRAVPLLIGVALLLFHSFAPGVLPYDLPLILGGALAGFSVLWFVFWIVTENRKTPVVERFKPDEQDLKTASTEILYLLEEGWGVKRVVDMISKNYKLQPRIVYNHVMELMRGRPDFAASIDEAAQVVDVGREMAAEFSDENAAQSADEFEDDEDDEITFELGK